MPTRRRAPAAASVPATVNGTYHWRVTSERARTAARIAGAPLAEDVGTIGKMTLRNGKWVMGDIDPEDYSGTYEIVGNRLVFDWSGAALTFIFNRHAGGDIDLEPIPPMDLGDAVVWAGGRWRLVGPPVREILDASAARRARGSSAVTRRPCPRLSTSSRPPTASTRSASPRNPVPPPITAPPTPSSTTSTYSRSALSVIEMTTRGARRT